MTDDYARYEKECEIIRTENAQLLEAFSNWLEAKGLSEATINKHRANIDFYINEYLLYEDAQRPEDGVLQVGMFLGYWFIRKAMWASAASIKSNATSLKKFYGFMLENDRIERKKYDELRGRIKEDMPEWLATLERYDDPNIEDLGEIWRW